MAVPKYDDMFNAVLQSLHDLGGSGTISEIEDSVAKLLKLSDKDVNELHRGNRTKLNYRLAWTRNYLKRYGLLENSALGVWSLTPKGIKTAQVDKSEVNRAVKSVSDEPSSKADIDSDNSADLTEIPKWDWAWENDLHKELMQLSPSSFERLAQRILRESGFVEVKVTGRTGDGGIDGFGTYRLASELLSFKVIFQCKRYKKSITSPQMREFKGTMVGRAEKGLFITTSTFTAKAKEEAQRDGAAPIELIDGSQLLRLMRRLRLGVIETVEVDKEWFERFD